MTMMISFYHFMSFTRVCSSTVYNVKHVGTLTVVVITNKRFGVTMKLE